MGLAALAALSISVRPCSRAVAGTPTGNSRTIGAGDAQPAGCRGGSTAISRPRQCSPMLFSQRFRPPSSRRFRNNLSASSAPHLRSKALIRLQAHRPHSRSGWSAQLPAAASRSIPVPTIASPACCSRAFDPVGDSKAKIEADLARPARKRFSAWFGPLKKYDGGASVISIAPEQGRWRWVRPSNCTCWPQLPRRSPQVNARGATWLHLRCQKLSQRADAGLATRRAGDASHSCQHDDINFSDNTATDQLIKVLGRDTVLALLRRTGHARPGSMIPS